MNRLQLILSGVLITSGVLPFQGQCQTFWDSGTSETYTVGDIVAKGNVTYAIKRQSNNTDTIQKWDKKNGWSLVVSQEFSIGNLVALEVQGDYLYVLGNFSSIGGTSAANIAKYNVVGGTPAWSALGSGVPFQDGSKKATCIAVDSSGNVYVGYSLNTTGSSSDSGLVRKWNGSTWSTINDTFSYENSTSSGDPRAGVLCLATDGNDLYVGGHFNTVTLSTSPYTVFSSPNIIKYAAGTWQQCVVDQSVNPTKYGVYWNGDSNNGSGRVYGIAPAGNSMFVVGHFEKPNIGIARFLKSDRSKVAAVDLTFDGVNTADGTDIRVSGASEAYFVGNFGKIAGTTGRGIGKVSVDGSGNATWSTLSEGLKSAAYDPAAVKHVAIGSSAVYATGDQYYAGSANLNSKYYSRWVTNPSADPCMPPQLTGWGRSGNIISIYANSSPSSPYGPPINYYWWINGNQNPSLNGYSSILVDPATVTNVAVYVYGFGSGVSVGIYNEDTNQGSVYNNYYNCP